MPHHMHLITVPADASGLPRVLGGALGAIGGYAGDGSTIMWGKRAFAMNEDAP